MLIYVDVLLTCCGCSFNSLGSWFYFEEWGMGVEFRDKKDVPLLQGSEIPGG